MSLRTMNALRTRVSGIAATLDRSGLISLNKSVSPSNSLAAISCVGVPRFQWRAYAEKSTETVEKPEVDTQVDGAAVKKLTQEVETLTKEVQTLKEKNEDLLDKYKRALADSENLRVRLTKQIADAKVFGIQSFCKDLLEVADTLGCATDAVPKDKLTSNQDLKNLYEGLTMTKASLLQVFKRHGLEPVNPLNEKFDPNIHEALFQKDEPSVEPNTIIEVTKLGYKLHERCIRPALVGVSKSS